MQVLWTGMFQGAFKHQVLKKGVDDVYYLKRADFQLPIPPLPTLEVAPEAIPDLREVYGLAEDGTIYVMGDRPREAEVGERRVRVLPEVSFDLPVTALKMSTPGEMPEKNLGPKTLRITLTNHKLAEKPAGR